MKASGDPEIFGVLWFFLMEHKHKGLFHKNQNKLCYFQAEVNTVKKQKNLEWS